MASMIKFCGMMREEDLEAAAELGIDFFGVVVGVDWSKRSCSVAHARALFSAASTLALPGVALFCNADMDFVLQAAERINPFAIQLQGHETPETVSTLRSRLPFQVWKAVHVSPQGQPQRNTQAVCSTCLEYRDAGASVIIIDTIVERPREVEFGGTGKVGDWAIAAQVVRAARGTFFLAGGITPDNVLEAIETVNPQGIDLASGIEISPGVKDPHKMRALVENVRTGRI